MLYMTSDLCKGRRDCWPQRAKTEWWGLPGWQRWAWPRYLGWCPPSWSRWSLPPSLTLKPNTQDTRDEFLHVVFYIVSSSRATRSFVWPRDSAAMKAVVTLLAHRTAAWVTSTLPLVRPPRPTAATAARNPTTVAWTWGWRTEQRQGNKAMKEQVRF